MWGVVGVAARVDVELDTEKAGLGLVRFLIGTLNADALTEVAVSSLYPDSERGRDIDLCGDLIAD